MSGIVTMYEIGAAHPERHRLVGLDDKGDEVRRLTFKPGESVEDAARRLKQDCYRCNGCGEVVTMWHNGHWCERPANLSTLGTIWKVWRDRRPCPDCAECR